LRVLFLSPQPFFEVRGTPLAVRFLTEAIASLGHEVDLLTYPRGEDLPRGGVRHSRSLPLPVGTVKPGPSLAKVLLDVPFLGEAFLRMLVGRYDLVHAVEEAALLVAPWASLLGLPLVVDMDSSIPEQLADSPWASPLAGPARGLEGFALSHAVAVVTVCPRLTDAVRTRRPAARVFQIEDPPLPGTLQPAPEVQVQALRQALGLGEDPVVLYTGNFESYQGVEWLVDATPEVEGVSFLFVGGEPDEIERLRARAERLGTLRRCVFAGKRPPSDLPAFLSLATLLVSPRSRGLNTPFKIYTYMASRKPLVATRIETHTQVLDDRVAFLVEPSPQGLAGGIREAMARPGEATRRAQAAFALLEREYTEERYREKVRRAYESIQELVGRRP
jgi:glycosyltransferase involved in cell wall biosynthesis